MKRFVPCFALCVAGVTSCAAAGAIRVMTYNIHHGEGTDGLLDLDRVIDVILSAQADIVCLQEIDRNCERSAHIDFPAELAKRLDMNVAFGPNLKLGEGDYGVATLTRFPIVSHENHRLPAPSGAETRGCLATTVEVDGRELLVLNTHWGLDQDERLEQSAAIVDLLRNTTTILAGDFNETAEDPALAILLQSLQDTFLANQGDVLTTIGHGHEAKRIDFVLVSRDLNVLSSRVIMTAGAKMASDHLPYVTDLALPDPPETAADRGIYDQEDDERVEEAVTDPRDP